MHSISRAAGLTIAAAAISLGACSASSDPVSNDAMSNDMAMTNDIAMPGDMMGNDAGTPPMVGGAAMLPSKTIVENASAASNLTTLVAAVKAAGLVDTLSGPGPFTVFAPTNDAFAKLPAGTVDTLVKPESKAQLTKILTYHVVPGDMSAANLMEAIKAGGGKAELTTVQGEKLTATMSGGNVILTDAKGGTATVTQADVKQSNGVVHVIDSVLMP
jgi:uncharacterized surface protein with fasciclin (FAS1) repeats